MLTKGTNLRFWCQKVLPLVYDDSLSYYELLNKVVLHLNQNTENINQLIDFYNTFAKDVEDIIRQMMDDGDFNEIVADTIGSIIAEEYEPTKPYIIFDYCIFESKLYRANGSTTGVFDPEKWDERTVGYDLATIQNYIYTLNAGNVAYDPTASYESGTVGNKIKNLNANDVAYNSSETYDNDTVGKEIKDLNTAITSVEVANTYTSLLDFINATKAIKPLPFSFKKDFDGNFSDVPTINNSSAYRFIGIVYGKDNRIACDIMAVGVTDTRFVRQIATNAWFTNWEKYVYQTEYDALQQQITANVQTSTTATRQYKKGEYIVLNGTLYRVTATIDNGDSIVIGTNVTSDTVENAIKKVDLTLTNVHANIEKASMSVINGILYLNFHLGNASLSAGANKMFDFSSEIPAIDGALARTVAISNGQTDILNGIVEIYEHSCRINTQSAGTYNLTVNASFVVDNIKQ